MTRLRNAINWDVAIERALLAAAVIGCLALVYVHGFTG